MVDGNLDNVDADYQGKYACLDLLQFGEGVTLAEMTATSRIGSLSSISSASKKR
jgi:nitrous-oxide reductase